jgi:L-ascorbate metabolism protein UlaG (beta-lactamase superfamily)
MPQNTDIELTMVSHACIKIDGAFGSLLCDPWIVNEPVYNFTTWKFPDVAMSPEQVVAGVTHVFISHGHEDHFHVPSLDLIPRDVTLLLPEYSWHPGLRAQTIELTLRRLGFYDIRKMRPWESIDIGGEVCLTFVPPARSKPQDWENCALVIDHPSARIINVNDCPTDAELYQELSRRFDHFDVALIQYAGVSTFPGRFKFTEHEMREAMRKKRANFDEQDRAVEFLNVDYIVPFAGDFCWLDDTMLHCNWASRATPVLFKEWCAGNHPDRNFELLLMYPSDVWSKGAGVTRNHPGVDWDNYLDAILELKTRMQPKIDAINGWMAESDVDDLKRRSADYVDRMVRHSCRDFIDFSAAIRFRIEGPDAGFSFVLEADPVGGFRAHWRAGTPTDHTCYLTQAQWASVLAGKIMFNTLHWTGVIDQHVAFRLDMAKFWWWIEYYSDLTNRGPQVILAAEQYPHLRARVAPQLGVFRP